MAVVLSLCIISGLALPQTNITAYASTELTNEDLGAGASEATAYTWKQAQGANEGSYGGTTWRFDLCGLLAGQSGYSTSGIQTTWSWRGFATWLGMAQNESNPQPPVVGNSNTNFIYKANGPTNGAVETITNMGVEFKMTVTPSKDNKYVFVDYYVNDKSGLGGTEGRTFYLGTGADSMINGDDGAICYKNTRGFHMVNRTDKTVFDCITKDDSLGVTEPTTRYLGDYYYYQNNLFKESAASDTTGVSDSGIAYSWKFKLRPYETIHKRVAFAIRSTSYYVSNTGTDSTAAEGTYSSPFKTIDYALTRIGNKKGYIYVMDYPDISAPIAVTAGSLKDITIASTDYDASGNPTAGTGNYIKTLKRASGYTGPIFTVAGATLKLTDITLDGNGNESDSALVSAATGTLEINSGATLQNNKGSISSKGSAVDITGAANLTMNYGTVSNNISSGKGAVYFDSSGAFSVNNLVTIDNNANGTGGKSNVYLANGKKITVLGDLDASKIGVTSEQLPESSVGGIATTANQEVVVAVPSASYPGISSSCPFVDNFFADLDSGDGSGIYTSVGTGTLNNGKNTVLKRNGYTVTFVYRDAQTNGTVTGAPTTPEASYGVGEVVTLSPPSAISGYTFTGVDLDQGISTALSVETTPGTDFGKVTGTMPGQDVVVTYEYTKVDGTISFDVNGGTPQPDPLTGAIGASVNALLPQVSRYGYEFKGWSPVNDRVLTNIIAALPSVFPNAPITYYAVFLPNILIKFDYTVDYTNKDGSIVFQSTTSPLAYSVEEPISSQKKTIHGYAWSLADSLVNPDEFNYADAGVSAVGSFDGPTGNFTGRMPAQDTAVTYAYTVDYSNPSARSDFTIRYVSQSGSPIKAPDITPYFPEEGITAAPASVYGYNYVSGSITGGDTADDTDGNLVSAFTGTFDGQGNFTGKMPNQESEITYVYEATGEGYEYKVSYIDNDTTDSNLRNIVDPEVSSIPADTSVGAVYRDPYGYTFDTETAQPASAGTFASNHDYSGIMPNDNLAVTYYHDRDSAKWADITYQAGAHGSLSAGTEVSSDVTALGGGKYKASILKDDGTAPGATDSYTFSTIESKRLVPTAAADEYYRPAGWFIDTNGDGIKDAGEEMVDAGTRFTGDTTLTALFEEDPAKWIDIHFAAGAHGSLNAGEITGLHLPYDKTWGDINSQLPAFTPEINYLTDDWYDGAQVMEAGRLLENGHTYTIQFYPDPAVFGTDVGAPDVLAGINTSGKGKVTAYQTTAGYKYIITDLDGTIVDVKTGNISGRVIFDDLYPGTRYQVYEADGTAQAQIGFQIGSVTGSISAPAEVLIPVVETNYQIVFDEEHEGKTVLVIKPADKASDYAVLDKNGNVVESFKNPTGYNPSAITFPGLDYNEEYVVVARPHGETGITEQSRYPDGTTLVMDPGGELDIPKYIVETLHGVVVTVDGEDIGTSRFDEVHKGDEVVIHADAANGAGEAFKHWKVTIGSVPGIVGTIAQEDVTFTMPDTNVVLTAYYTSPTATPSNATVVDEVRGGNEKELALDPDAVADLEDLLTTADDRVLIDVNHADVTYKVIYRKNAVKAAESTAIKSSPLYDSSHEGAYRGAWGLDVDIERYVNGRKTAMATPSNATFNTYVQLDKEDVDMMDYQLFRVETDPIDGSLILTLEAMSEDPEETGGLFTFTAEAGKRYVLVYSKAFRLYFINNQEEPKYRYYFKVRKGEAPGDSDYSLEYSLIEDPMVTFVNSDGVEFNFVDWSYREDKHKAFDPDQSITKKTYVYAYYEDNSKELDEARKELEEALQAAIDKADDYFLTLKETAEIKEAIEEALEVFDKTGPKATIEELLEALNKLEEACNPFDEILDDRYDDYEDIQDSGSKGGSGGGGGSGSGAKAKPFNPEKSKSYVVGTNGNWVQNAETGKWSFVLNAGIHLTGMWAKLDYANGDVNKNGWYHFNANGFMDSGWFRDEKLDWYYCNTVKDGWLGKMKMGWHYDEADKHWYYLDEASGMMARGWQNIGGKWYYFTAQNNVNTYTYNGDSWIYTGNNHRPLGSMYVNETTPDGYKVGADGAWIE